MLFESCSQPGQAWSRTEFHQQCYIRRNSTVNFYHISLSLIYVNSVIERGTGEGREGGRERESAREKER